MYVVASHGITYEAQYYSVLCETSFSEFKSVNEHTIVQDTIQGLLLNGIIHKEDQVITTWTKKVTHCYPTPSLERDNVLNEVIPWLEERGMYPISSFVLLYVIYSRGRFGLWKYEVANTDHSMMQGVELVNYWHFNIPECTKEIKYKSTDTGREGGKELK